MDGPPLILPQVGIAAPDELAQDRLGALAERRSGGHLEGVVDFVDAVDVIRGSVGGGRAHATTLTRACDAFSAPIRSGPFHTGTVWR